MFTYKAENRLMTGMWIKSLSGRFNVSDRLRGSSHYSEALPSFRDFAIIQRFAIIQTSNARIWQLQGERSCSSIVV